jgi:dipeptidyl aminopeptidase/acylaminoacyl peptidase
MRLAIIAAVAVAGQAAAAAPIPTPVTAITDPASLASPANPAAQPVPLGDLSAVRGVYGAAWSADGRSLVVAPNLTGRYNLWRVDRGGNFPVQLTTSNDAQSPAEVARDGQVLFTEDRGGDELYDIYGVPITGGAVVNLTRTPEATEDNPRLSPDQRAIVFTHRTKTGTAVNLGILDRATGKVRMLTQEKDPSRLWSAAVLRTAAEPS